MTTKGQEWMKNNSFSQMIRDWIFSGDNMYKVEKTNTGYKVDVKKDAYNYSFWNEHGHTRMNYNYQKNEIRIPETGQLVDLPKSEWFNLFLNKPICYSKELQK